MKLFQKFWALFMVGSVISICMGFYKMLVYKSNEFSPSLNANAYVGGDAYNYIINAGYATAWFAFAGILMLLSCTLLLMNKLDEYPVIDEKPYHIYPVEEKPASVTNDSVEDEDEPEGPF